MLKKFRKNDIFINRIKAYPKVEFFVNSGSVDSVYYNRQIEPSGSNIPDGHVGLYDLIKAVPEVETTGSIDTNKILTEDSDNIATEVGDNLIIE